ncbi:jg973 [Pararge aegeria aegeria]|uniref:Jg973 protein n=1 Tax=Pararge aegeria aegeria TaxID=348720 RepID=A0A8S4SB63_9NEOP|nr:jg973 [Pararge aegeria aegeria]
MTSGESLGAAGGKRPRTVYCGTPYKRPKSSSGRTLVEMMMMTMNAIGHVSGGHVNPAVTAGMAATGKVKPVRAILYVIAQCAGAAAGSGLLKAFTPDAVAGKLGVTGLGTNVTALQGFGIEFFLGFVLVFVVCGVCDPNKPDSKATAPLAIGLTVTLGHLLAVDYTGSAMNPARSFGSALVASEWSDHWVYWAGPVAGGVAAALLYVHGFSAPPPDTNSLSPRYRPVAADEKELKRLDGKGEDMA